MEYVPGIKINKIQALDQLGVDRKRFVFSYIFLPDLYLLFLFESKIVSLLLIDNLVQCRLGRYAVESYLEQILSHGFFHADPVSLYPFFFTLSVNNL
jgi:hypothetical protein